MRILKHKTIIILLFTSTILLSCGNKNTTYDNVATEIGNENSLTNSIEIIKKTNENLLVAFKNKKVNTWVTDEYYYTALKDGDKISFISKTSFDSEGWPMEVTAFYLLENKLIGYSQYNCDGCIKEQIVNKLKAFPIKEYSKDKNIESSSDELLVFTKINNESLDSKLQNEIIIVNKAIQKSKSQDEVKIALKLTFNNSDEEGNEKKGNEQEFKNNTLYTFCYDSQSFNKLSISGNAKNLTLEIKEDNKVIFQKQNFEIIDNISFSSKELEIGGGAQKYTVILKQNDTVLFNGKIDSQGCL